MSRSLADLRADSTRSDKPKARPERAQTICLRPDLVAEMQSLTEELSLLEVPTDEEGDRQGPPRRMGEGEHPRSVEIRDRIAELIEEMGEHEGELKVRANLTDGEWRRWCNEHPPRKENEPGYQRDIRLTSAFCNADDLIDDLGRYVYTWDGEPLSESDWADIFEPVVSGGDKNALGRAIVEMYENRVDFPSWRSGLSTALKRSNDSASPATSESPTDDSTAGNPAA